MIALIQRVTRGKVVIEKKDFSKIGPGYVILLGIFQNDNEGVAEKLVKKIVNLRVMSDEQGKMNKSITDAKGEILVVSQFTLAADLSGGRRPSFIKAMEEKEAEKLYEFFIRKLQEKNLIVKAGKFGASMNVEISNDGPVTIIADSKKI